VRDYAKTQYLVAKDNYICYMRTKMFINIISEGVGKMISKIYQFKVPQLIIWGAGSAKEVGTLAKGWGRKAMLVTDHNLEKLGLLDEIKNSLEMAQISWATYNQVTSEPTDLHVDQGVKIFRESGADFLIALGGGSPIDAAKAIAILFSNGGKISDYMGANKIPKPGPPLVAIPTTAGTGSEVTQFTIITDTSRDVKMLIASPYLIPRLALLDPLLTRQMPPQITAATGIDALTHAIEAYVSIKAQPLSDTLALDAIRLISGNLRQAWANGDNLEARSNMMVGALEAGMAFSNSSVALVHGMARPIGAYFHIPHGVSNAVLLPTVMEFSIPGNPQRYADIAKAMGEITEGLSTLDAAYLAAKALKRLNGDLKIPSLRELGVDEKKFNAVVIQMAADALASGSPGNNPRKATQEEIVELYKKVF
jgi:alcohol dehydrogenase class IV